MAQALLLLSQPQNLHLRVLGGYESPSYIQTRAGGPAFFKPAVDALTRIDGCFGAFIEYLTRNPGPKVAPDEASFRDIASEKCG